MPVVTIKIDQETSQRYRKNMLRLLSEMSGDAAGFLLKAQNPDLQTVLALQSIRGSAQSAMVSKRAYEPALNNIARAMPDVSHTVPHYALMQLALMMLAKLP